MKKITLLSFSFFLILCLSAQDVKQGLKIPASYDRSSITFVLLNFPNDYHSRDILSKINMLAYGDKFYNNNVSYLTLQSPFNRSELPANKIGLIKQSLENNKIANEIIDKWYSTTNEGYMSLDLIHKRGMFNATDATFLLAKTTKRGNAELEDYGNRLINKSYILVLDYQNVLTMSEAKRTDSRGWQANVTAYLFKLDYNEEVQKKVYDLWIYEDDPQELKEKKKTDLKQLVIPINFIAQTNRLIDASQKIQRTTLERVLFPDKSQEELLDDLVQKGYDENLYSLEKVVEDFKVKTTISETKPLKAKIGKKEGLKTDNRFFAYEYILNENNNTTRQKYRGVIRATSKITDNRQVATGNMEKTVFYQTAGKRLEVGYLLQQRNDSGIEVSLGLEYGDVNGYYGRIDYRLGRYIGVRSLFAYLEFALDGDDPTLSRYGAGLAKGIQLSRNIEIRPYIGIGNQKYIGEEYADEYYKVGVNLSINILRNVQLYTGCGYYIFVDSDYYNGLAISGGLKFGF